MTLPIVGLAHLAAALLLLISAARSLAVTSQTTADSDLLVCEIGHCCSRCICWQGTLAFYFFLYLIAAALEVHLVDRGVLFVITGLLIALKFIISQVILHMLLVLHIIIFRWSDLRCRFWSTFHFSKCRSAITSLLKLHFLRLLLSNNASLSLWIKKSALHCRVQTWRKLLNRLYFLACARFNAERDLFSEVCTRCGFSNWRMRWLISYTLAAAGLNEDFGSRFLKLQRLLLLVFTRTFKSSRVWLCNRG